MFLLDEKNLSKISDYLHIQKWKDRDENVIAATKPGDGNMNCVLRINTGHRTFILKQSRNFVEKYPQVPAPQDRVKSEAAFFSLTKHELILAEHMPAILGFDDANNILMIEDLGVSSDYSFLYKNKQILKDEEVLALTQFLHVLHNKIVKNNDPLLQNIEMKQLNHKYIFVYPFMDDNGLDLNQITEGLEELSTIYKTDAALKRKAVLLGEKYLEEGRHLLHGDYYPGSWLHTNEGLKIIDPEFCFFGPAEFDLAIMIAHCHLAQQPQHVIELIINSYHKKEDFNITLMYQFAGIEIMRRILGLAQLPLKCSLDVKTAMLQKSYEFIMQ